MAYSEAQKKAVKKYNEKSYDEIKESFTVMQKCIAVFFSIFYTVPGI